MHFHAVAKVIERNPSAYVTLVTLSSPDDPLRSCQVVVSVCFVSEVVLHMRIHLYQ